MLSCLLPYFLIFDFEKKSLVLNFYTKWKLILNTMISLKLTKYFKVCYFFLSTKVNMFYLSCVLFLIHRSELKYYH